MLRFKLNHVNKRDHYWHSEDWVYVFYRLLIYCPLNNKEQILLKKIIKIRKLIKKSILEVI